MADCNCNKYNSELISSIFILMKTKLNCKLVCDCILCEIEKKFCYCGIKTICKNKCKVCFENICENCCFFNENSCIKHNLINSKM